MGRTYVRRRLTVTLVTGAIGVIAWQSLADGALAAPNVLPVVRREYVVREGDTLWDLAPRVAPGSDPRKVVTQIAATNDVEPGDIVPGQMLVLPAAGEAGG